jgi:glycosyltransferase involved in cell wall biosynthesis
MSAVIVTPDLVGPIKNGGIGTFATNFAFLLARHGCDVSIIFTNPVEVQQDRWLSMYRQQHIQVDMISDGQKDSFNSASFDFVLHSQDIAERIPQETDVVYFQDWQANGFIAARRRRFALSSKASIVTVLHSPSSWLRKGMGQFPDSKVELGLDFAERYAAENSDFVISPSEYMLHWVKEQGWKLPSDQRIRVLGYPYFPNQIIDDVQPQQPTDTFKRITFFGRLETRKGLEIFIEALHLLSRSNQSVFKQIEEIILLGKEGQSNFGSSKYAESLLKEDLGINVQRLTDKQTDEAIAVLIKNVQDNLVVIPSLVDNFPFTVIEASLIPGLNFICANTGGIPELLTDRDKLFEPTTEALAKKIEDKILRGPVKGSQKYDWESANQAWLDFHDEASLDKRKPFMMTSPIIRTHNASGRLATPAGMDICIAAPTLTAELDTLLKNLTTQSLDSYSVYIALPDVYKWDDEQNHQNLPSKYSAQDWSFSYISSRHLGALWNHSASLGNAPFICFLDASVLPSPQLFAQMLEDIRISSDDCLSCYTFTSQRFPLSASWNDLFESDTSPIEEMNAPLGNCISLGLLMDVWGGIPFIIRRSSFEQAGGFYQSGLPSDSTQSETHDLFARLALKGHKIDVVPNILARKQITSSADSIFKLPSTHSMRILEVYRNALSQRHLEDLPSLVIGMYRHLDQDITQTMPLQNPQWLSRHVSWSTLIKSISTKISAKVKI